MSKLVWGVGFNDKTRPANVDGKNVKEYQLWQDMLTRCFSEKLQTPTTAPADKQAARRVRPAPRLVVLLVKCLARSASKNPRAQMDGDSRPCAQPKPALREVRKQGKDHSSYRG